MTETASIPASVHQTAKKSGEIFVHYAPPLLGLAAGYVMGDMLNIGNLILTQVNKGSPGTVAEKRQVALFLTAGIYAFIAITLWKFMNNAIGHFIAGFFGGVALRALLRAVGM